MSEHNVDAYTAEPWFPIGTPPYLAMDQVYGDKRPISIGSSAHTEEIATVWTYLLPTEANARRICAAVNACAGIPTETLERATANATLVIYDSAGGLP